MYDNKISQSVKSILIAAYLATTSFYSCPAGRLDRMVDRG